MRGLIGRRELEPGEGIVLRPSWSVHTFFMRSSIDVVFVDVDQVVAQIVPKLKPWRWATCRGARDVVELRAGECERSNVRPGQRLAWAARPERPPEVAGQAEKRPQAAIPHLRNGKTRVLLGTEDDRFLRLARFLLTRQDYEVEATKRVGRTFE